MRIQNCTYRSGSQIFCLPSSICCIIPKDIHHLFQYQVLTNSWNAQDLLELYLFITRDKSLPASSVCVSWSCTDWRTTANKIAICLHLCKSSSSSSSGIIEKLKWFQVKHYLHNYNHSSESPCCSYFTLSHWLSEMMCMWTYL